jgi:AAA domain
MNIYKPANSITLSEVKVTPQIRAGIQGYPGTGKTWGALTFPNPVVFNIDRGLGAHIGRSDVIEIPAYDDTFCRTINPQYHKTKLKDLVIKWLETEGKKLTADQTLVFDGNTGLQNAYHSWYEVNKQLFLTAKGEVNDFKEWTQKKVYFGEVMEIFKTLQCNVVYICHEADQKDKNGVTGPSYSGKVRPLLTGAFSDEIAGYFTDWFRAQATDKPTSWDSVVEADIKAKWMMTKAEYKQWCDSFPRQTTYYWQTESDNIFDAKASSLVNFPRFIPANYTSFAKYRRKIS